MLNSHYYFNEANRNNKNHISSSFPNELLYTIDKKKYQPHYNITLRYLNDKKKTEILNLIKLNKPTRLKPYKPLSLEEIAIKLKRNQPFIHINNDNQIMFTNESTNTILKCIKDYILDSDRNILYDSNTNNFITFNNSLKDSNNSKQTLLKFNQNILNYLFNDTTDYNICLPNTKLNSIVFKPCTGFEDTSNTTNDIPKRKNCIRFKDLKITSNASTSSDSSNNNDIIEDMNRLCIPNLKKSLYNLSQGFQAYEGILVKLLIKLRDIYPNMNIFKYYNGYSESNSVRYFDKDEKGNKIIFTVYIVRARNIDDFEIESYLGYVVNVFYVDNYESYSYNYIDLNIPENQNNNNNNNTPLNFLGGTLKLSKQRKINKNKTKQNKTKQNKTKQNKTKP